MTVGSCAACGCPRVLNHGINGTDPCSCGCKGFFPEGAKYCDNPACEGTCCKYARDATPGTETKGGTNAR